ncbi:MAG: Fe-S protein assembly co-chaperone HscB [Bryobacteraceae bacterium]
MNAHWHYYELFGLAPKLGICPDDLQQRFYELSRKLHPDRFVRKSDVERQHALDASSELNDAYRTLKDSHKRAEYVLKQEGFDIGEQRSKDVPPELLEEVFELNMALEEMRSGDDSARPQLEAAQHNFSGMLSDVEGQLEKLFDSYDASPDQGKLAEMRAVLNRRRYIRNLVNEVEKELSKQNVEL